MFVLQGDPDSSEMAAVNPRTRADFDAHWAGSLSDPGVVPRAILADGEFAGWIGCFKSGGDDAVGYWIARDHWGRGIATRALALILQEVSIRPMHAQVAMHNGASKRVLERNGFVLEGTRHSAGDARYRACEEALYVLR